MSHLDFSNLTVEYITNVLDSYIKSVTEFNDSLITLDNDSLTWDSYIQKGLDFDGGWADKLTVFEMSSFHPNELIRDTCHDSETKLSNFGIEQSMRKDLFAKFKHYYHNQYQAEKESLTLERIRYIEEAMRDYCMDGLELPDEKYEKVKELKKEISTHSINFTQNLNNYDREFILRKEQLTGVPDSWLSSRVNLDGNYKVNLKYPDYLPIMERCSNRETRKMISEEFNQRCLNENKPIIDCIFKLRNDLAKEFGFELYSDYKLQDRMAKNTSNVMDFLLDLKTKIKPVLDSDYEKILSIARLDDINTFEDLKTYDLSYYSRIYTEKECDLDMEEVKQYFPLEQIIKGTFDIYSTLLGLKFIDVSSQYLNTFWYSDVKLFQAINTADNTLQGEFYLDLHPRIGKYGHAAVFPIKRGSIKAHPICIMACNFPNNENLSFDDIVTFFHEFGHVMHSITSRPELSSMSGTSVPRDAVECPSQMLEEWCYRANSLQVLAPRLPYDVINKLIKQKNMLQGYFNARQLSFCFLDMELHGKSYSTPNPNKLFSKIYKEILGLELDESHGFIQTFGHLMGYESGYYGYLYSQSFAKCMFEEKFKEHELDPVIGMEYRNKITAPGNTKEFMDLMIDFLGHMPTSDAFIKSLIG
jgi:Zn-dependent oligopeptidase